jgi:hypothetical protein
VNKKTVEGGLWSQSTPPAACLFVPATARKIGRYSTGKPQSAKSKKPLQGLPPAHFLGRGDIGKKSFPQPVSSALLVRKVFSEHKYFDSFGEAWSGGAGVGA